VTVERVTEKEVPVYVDVPVYRENKIRREIPKIIQQEVIYETVVPVERVNIIEETVEVPIERIIERPIEHIVERRHDVIIEKEVIEDNIIEDIQYRDKIVHVNVERKIERPVMKENIIQKDVFIEKIVQKEVENIIYKDVEVPVEKIVEVPVDIVVERPVFVDRIINKDVYVDKNIKNTNTNFTYKETDLALAEEYRRSQSTISEWQMKVARARAEYELLTKKTAHVTLKADIDYTSQNTVLRQKIEELKVAIANAKDHGIIRKSLFTGNQELN
jgi:hypothetical protein